ncbi:MAG: PA domain-containing protein [Candidatus Eisenbacteria bacterium]
MRFRLALLGVLGFVTAVQANELQVGANQITVDHLRQHVETLTDPKLDGRANGSEGAETAARYIEDQFKAVGLKPAGTERYRQGFRVYSGVRVEGVIGLRDLSRGYEFNKDYTPLGLSDDGKQLASLVFAGYGVSAPELGYDDYEGIDVAGKIVLAFLGEPGMQDPDSPFDGLAQTIHSDLYQKAEMAREHGAVGLLLTPGPLYTRDPERLEDLHRRGDIATPVSHRAAHGQRLLQAMVDPAGLDRSGPEGDRRVAPAPLGGRRSAGGARG